LRVKEAVVAFAVGKPEPTRLDVMTKDLRLSTETVGNLRLIRKGLERTRRELIVHRNQVGMFKAGVMGFHLGAEEGGLGVEDELMVLEQVVEEMKRAVGGVKGGIGTGPQGGKGRLALGDGRDEEGQDEEEEG
jgi:hypothetical protein